MRRRLRRAFPTLEKSTLSTTMHYMHDETIFERLLLSIFLCLAAMDGNQLVSSCIFPHIIKDYHNLIYEFHTLIGEVIMWCWKLPGTSRWGNWEEKVSKEHAGGKTLKN